jgi:ABC-2 type transport system ATP-binding protein
LTTPADIPAGTDGVFKQAWTASLITSVVASGAGIDDFAGHDAIRGGSAAGDPPASPAACGRLTAPLCAAYVQVATTGRVSPEMTKLLADSSPARVVSDITAPTLLVQGEQDTLFGLDQADANARAIAAAGTPVAVSWYPGGHSGGALDTRSQDRITNWLRYYLAGQGAKPSLAFRYAVAGSVTQRGVAQTRTVEVPTYPGLHGAAVAGQSVTLSGSPQTIVNPPGGEPAALTSLPGVGSLASGALSALTALPGQTAQFVSAPLTTPIVVTGSVAVDLTVSRVPNPAGAGADDSAVLYLSLVSSDPVASRSGGANGGGADTSPGDGSDAAGDPGSASTAGASGIPAALASFGSGPAGGAVAPIRIEHLPADGTPVTVTAKLPAVAFQVAAGKTLGIRVATTDQGFPASTTPAAYRVSLASAGAAGVDPAPGENTAPGTDSPGTDSQGAKSSGGVAQATVLVPVAGGTRINNDESPLWWAVALGAIVLFGLVGFALAGRSPRRPRRCGSTDDGGGVMRDGSSAAPDNAPAPLATSSANADPLVVAGLRKEYPGGVTAVADVSFTVRRGQVLGLLGPNGAGKTTTLRMVMGLISPSAGDIRLFGEPVFPGAPVLARVGSFVEGAGFLPHLSGRANLDLYWRATGRPTEAAFLDEALAIAGLGAAIKRKVRTYSQGMRQRLAIAQAMLGLPELLILDEPTNGLDPPQIHAMREVLRRYAATGRTVLISSHLLSEVEQTCTDVVIVSLGRTIAAGSVDELVSHSGDLLVSTPRPLEARDALAGLSGIGEFEVAPAGLAVDRGTVTVMAMMQALLDANVPVTAIAPRNRLEEVFLDLISTREGAAS